MNSTLWKLSILVAAIIGCVSVRYSCHKPAITKSTVHVEKPAPTNGCPCTHNGGVCQCKAKCCPARIERTVNQPAAVPGFVWANGVEFIPGKNWIFGASLGQQPIRHRWELWPESMFTKEELEAPAQIAPKAASSCAPGSACSAKGGCQ